MGLVSQKARPRGMALFSGVMCVALLALMQVLAAAPAQAHGHDQFRIGKYIGQTAYCLDVALQSGGGNGAPVQLWECHGGANQKWYSQGGTIRSAWTGRCLDVIGAGGQGAQLQLYDCVGVANQNWQRNYPYINLLPNSPSAGLYSLWAGHNGDAIDIPGNQWYNGQRPQIYPRNGTEAQQFHNNAG